MHSEGECQALLQRPDGKPKSSREQADLKESMVLHPPKASLSLLKKGNLDQRRLAKVLSPIPYLPSDFEIRTKGRREAQVDWPGLIGFSSYGNVYMLWFGHLGNTCVNCYISICFPIIEKVSISI